MVKINMINPITQIEKSSAWTKKPFTDGKLICKAKSPFDWTVKAMFDDLLAREKQTRKTKVLGAYERKVKVT
jgi:stalled ribosome alternative rescue factor ArfA